MPEKIQNLKSRIVKIYFEKIEKIVRRRDIDSLRHLSYNFNNHYSLSMEAQDDVECVSNLLKRLSEFESLSPKEFTLILVFWYLIEVEGFICNLLDFVSYLLVTTGHDLYSLTKRKYMKDNIEEIRKVEMSTKIQFLNHHGFGALTKEYDSTFRNNIAHHNFKIDEKGILWVRGKPVNIGSKLDPLKKIVDLMNEALKEINKKLEDIVNKMEMESPRS